VSVKPLSIRQTNFYEVNDRVNQLMQGRSNAVGQVTLSSTGATSTTVSAPACGPLSGVYLAPQTSVAQSSAAAFVASTNVFAGKFIISHSSSTSTNRIFAWAAFG